MPSDRWSPTPPASGRGSLVALVVLVALLVVLATPRPAPAQDAPDGLDGSTTAEAPDGGDAPVDDPADGPVDGGEPAPEVTTALVPTEATAPIVAVVVPDPNLPPPVQVEAFWVDPATAPSARPRIVVSFAEPFEVPTEPWRVAVSAGDPNAERVRSSLVTVGSTVTGVVERGDGLLWRDEGQTPTSASDGMVTVELPVEGLTPDAAVWVEAEVTVEGEVVSSVTPLVPLTDLLGRATEGLGTAHWATVVAAGTTDLFGAVAVDGPGPTVEVVGRALEVTTTTAVPTEVAGFGVTGVVDTVRITQGTAGTGAGTGPTAEPPRSERVEIDRTTGVVRRVPPPGSEQTIDTLRLAAPPSATSPGAPATVTFDLEELDVAFGGAPLERATTRVDVERRITLEGGAMLTSAGVSATMSWFDDRLAADTPAPVADGDEGGTSAVPWVLAGVVLVLAAVALAVALVRRRGAPDVELPVPSHGAKAPTATPVTATGDGSEADRADAMADGVVPVPGEVTDGVVPVPGEVTDGVVSVPAEVTDGVASVHREVRDGEADVAEPADDAELADDTATSGLDEPALEGTDGTDGDAEGTDEDDEGPGAGDEVAPGPSSTVDPLAALFAEVEALSARVDRIGQAAPAGDHEAGRRRS